ncbi:MAG: translation initiation factor IF-2 [Phycisphaerales bacterium]|nr:translation initiation factor IF-2 [Phycisphaerales bacterium]
MAKRIFEIAKELEVSSKAIVEKCIAEGIPGVNNHMSSISAGLEATIREWFSADHSVATAVETTEKVDLDKVKVRARRKGGKADHDQDAGGDGAETATTVAEPAPAVPVPASPPPVATPAPAAPSAKPAPAEAPAREGPPASIFSVRPPAPPAPVTPPAPKTAPTVDAPAPAPAVAPPAQRPAAAASSPAETRRPEGGAGAPAGRTPHPRPAPPTAPGEKPVMNVPQRPKAVAPAGPRLEVQTPAKLSGPKVVRIEAAEVIEAPRPRSGPPSAGGGMARGPRSGAGVRGGAGTTGARPGEEDASRSPRRNKRRAGEAAPGPAAKAKARPAESDSSNFNWREQDLAEREERLSRAGGFLRHRRRESRKGEHGERAQTAAETGGAVRIAAPFTIKELSAATGVKASDIVKKLFLQGVMATVNSGIEPDKAQEIMIEYDIDLQFEEKRSAEEVVSQQFVAREMVDERPRSPVVTILGHVDHGKTSLLDRIRNANVAEGEAGGITQATSAFRVDLTVAGEPKQLVFFDTPGHEAFTAMRARGASITDIVVLVVAADDGVMPQTIESINHAKAAKVPIVVALNKIDKAEATESNIQRIMGQLAEHGLNPTAWGGDTEVVHVSAVKGTGVTELLETVDYQAQLLNLRSDFGGAASGTVIESKLEEGRGPTANVLIQNGLLKVGDFIVAGRAFGRVRDIMDDRGARLREATPAMPVRISGLDELPDAGDKFYSVESLKQAQEAAEQRRRRDREKELAQPKVTLDSILAQLKEGEVKELRIVVKADVQGSVDVLRKAIEDVSTPEVKVRVLHSAVGGINESDILLSEASRAVVVGFNVIPSGKARSLAEQKGVEIRSYQVIYEIVDDMKKAAEGLLAPEVRQEVLGHAEVRKVFRVTRVGSVAGCYVTNGTIERNALIRVTRNGIVIENDRVLEQLKRFKDDAKEVRAGQECGMKIVGYDDIKEGDVLECYRKVEVRRSL